jgi:hypothetical protein
VVIQICVKHPRGWSWIYPADLVPAPAVDIAANAGICHFYITAVDIASGRGPTKTAL